MATILIIDQQAARRSFIVIALEQAGHRVIEAESGEQALQMTQKVQGVQRVNPDLVLLDVLVALPGGHSLLRRLHAQHLRQASRIVLLASPYLEVEARLLALSCGAAQVLSDILDTKIMLDAVDAALAAPPAPPLGAEDSDARQPPLAQMISRLHGRVAQLEIINARLQRKFILGADRLEIARSALDQEVSARLHTRNALLQENRRLRQESMRDPLTGLYNRRYLEASLNREESRARRSGWPMSVMMIDIDHFQQFNDTHGHAAGDEVLRAISRYLESLARSEDIVCRYGGGEFVLVMTNTAPETLWQRADALRIGVTRLHIEHKQHPIGPITLSIGLAIYPDNGDSARAVLRAADAALYHAKHSGRDRIEPAINA